MLASAQEACELIQGKPRARLKSDHVLELALTRLLEIIGEAANRVTPETQENATALPWRQIIGLRHR